MPVPYLLIAAAVVALFVLSSSDVLGKKIGRQPEDNARAAPKVGAVPTTANTRKRPRARRRLRPRPWRPSRDFEARPSRGLTRRGSSRARARLMNRLCVPTPRGIRETLKPLLTGPVMQSFEAGITAREARGDVEQAEFIHPPRADLELATVEGDRAVAKVRFLAELRNRVTPAGGGTGRGTAHGGTLDLRASAWGRRSELGPGPGRTRQRVRARGVSARKATATVAMLIAVLALSACATSPATDIPPATGPVVPVPVPDPAAPVTGDGVPRPAAVGQPLTALPGWDHEDHLAAFETPGAPAAAWPATRPPAPCVTGPVVWPPDRCRRLTRAPFWKPVLPPSPRGPMTGPPAC